MEEIRWSAPEYHYYEKTVSWYWAVIIAAGIIVIFALWQKNFLFAVFTVIAAALAISWGRREPDTVDFTLAENGIMINDSLAYPLESLEGFAVITDVHSEALRELTLKSKHRLRGWVKIIIAAEREEAIRAFLAEKKLPELDYEESLTEHITRLLRF